MRPRGRNIPRKEEKRKEKKKKKKKKKTFKLTFTEYSSTNKLTISAPPGASQAWWMGARPEWFNALAFAPFEIVGVILWVLALLLLLVSQRYLLATNTWQFQGFLFYKPGATAIRWISFFVHRVYFPIRSPQHCGFQSDLSAFMATIN